MVILVPMFVNFVIFEACSAQNGLARLPSRVSHNLNGCLIVSEDLPVVKRTINKAEVLLLCWVSDKPTCVWM